MAQEPVHRSLFDVLKENLAQEDRKSYIHRLIYFGRHNFTEGASSMKEFFDKNVNYVNSKRYDEELTGALIHYPKHFIHIVEGSENNIAEHIQSCFANPEIKEEKFETVKVLIVWHHIHERFFTNWCCVTGVPPTLLEEVHPESNMEEAEKIIKIFISKVIKLAELIVKQHSSDTAVPNISTKAQDLLPEYAVLESLLNLSALVDIRKCAELYTKIEESVPYQEHTWPVPTDFVPYDVYDQPFQPLELKEKREDDGRSTLESIPAPESSQNKPESSEDKQAEVS